MCAAVHIKLEVLYGVMMCPGEVKPKLRQEATVSLVQFRPGMQIAPGA